MGFLYFCSTLIHAVDPTAGLASRDFLISLCQVVLILPAPSLSHRSGDENPGKGFLAA